MIKKEAKDFRILIVDDISKNIQVLGNILRNENYQTGFATSGEQALKILEKHNFDLILLDVMMPGVDGYEVCTRIRENEKTKDIPILFLTAKVEKENIVKGFKVGAQDYLTKPFRSDELLSRVKTHLELSDQRKQLAKMNEALENQVAERTRQLQKAFTELEEASDKLSKLEKAKGDFLSIISHEMLTPLNGIIGFTDILNMTLTDEEQLEHLGFLSKSANRLLRFSETALLIAQLSVERYKFIFKDTHLKKIFKKVLNDLKPAYTEKKLNLKLDCQQPAIIYKCDIILMEIAFKNILNNAIKHSPENGTISISVEKSDNFLNLKIADEGPGFSDEVLENIFEHFATEKIMHHSEGFGLGLSSARLIVEAHGGKLMVENSKESGAVVTFKLKSSED